MDNNKMIRFVFIINVINYRAYHRYSGIICPYFDVIINGCRGLFRNILGLI